MTHDHDIPNEPPADQPLREAIAEHARVIAEQIGRENGIPGLMYDNRPVRLPDHITPEQGRQLYEAYGWHFTEPPPGGYDRPAWVDPAVWEAARNGPREGASPTWRHRQWTDVPQTERDARLAESRCVWCGVDLVDAGPEVMFCGDGHQAKWRVAACADLNSGNVPVDKPGNWNDSPNEGPPPLWLGLPAEEHGPGTVYAEPASPLGADGMAITGAFEQPRQGRYAVPPVRVRTAEPDGQGGEPFTVYDGPDLPDFLDYHLGLPDRLDRIRADTYEVRYAEHPPADAILCTRNTPTRTGQGTQLADRPRVPGAQFTLEETDPLPEPSTPWPIDRISTMQRQGWLLAVPARREARHTWTNDAPPLHPVRTCPRCGQTDVPLPVTAVFPAAASDAGNWRIEPARMTKLCCGQCLLPFRGPVVVPMFRRAYDPQASPPRTSRRGMWEFSLITTTAQVTMTVSAESIARAPWGDLGAHVWGDLYSQLAMRASAYRCGHPDCRGTHAPAHWLLLSGALAFEGCTWIPVDDLPLRLPLCAKHYAKLAMVLRVGHTRRWVEHHIPAGDGRMVSDGRMRIV